MTFSSVSQSLPASRWLALIFMAAAMLAGMLASPARAVEPVPWGAGAGEQVSAVKSGHLVAV